MAQKTKAKKKSKKKTVKKPIKKVNKKLSKKEKKIRYIMLWISIFIIIAVATILFLMSSVFNITKITVLNNKKISYEEIVQASTLQVNENRFKKSKNKINNNIKTIPYIETVKITKKLNGEVILDVLEREATYMLRTEEKYAYINNQGYILEISDVALNLPIITGYSSQNITPGGRLEVKDLKKLDTLIEIQSIAKTQNISDLITEINITNDKNFILSIPSQKKTVEFGEGTDINVKILKLIEVLKKTEGQEGTIFMKNRVYFSEKV